MAQTNRIALLQKAENAARKGEYDEALGIVSRCLDLYPGFSPARVLKGEILARTGSPDGAIAELREIIASNPENIRARMILTELLIQQNDQKQAMIHLEFLSFMVPENDPALLDLRQRAEDLQPFPVADEETPQTLEFGIIEEAEEEDAQLLPDEPGRDEEENVILEDEVTEIFMEEDLKQGSDGRTIQVAGDVNEQLEEVLESESIQESEIVTVHAPDDEGESDEPAKENVEINTLTMARVYERQKMYTEALDILEALYAKGETEELASEIKRLGTLSESGTIADGRNRRTRVIVSLNNWMEKITCNSTN
ncbi:MAG: hypothetical protein CO090_01000 [Acidobacteria bacterium CG_4_9_14_3_um_filter_49_7]|nr:MAG: hypothetical protein CO090_01000 [Acidobacteria bacterium CG_4_9_14_3_um_filter_49_7]